jgi:AcrR family transcriptional regulator
MKNSSDSKSLHADKISTKQKILDCAIHLFSKKGYTETSVRELAAAVGVKEASIYNHFPSKNAILEHILEEYSHFIRAAFEKDKLSILKKNPSADSIMSSMTIVFTEGREEYYLKMLYVILQEQHRNPIVSKFETDNYILGNEQTIKTMINNLKELGVLRPDTDPDFWEQMHSSLIYTFASRHMMGIGDNAPDFSGLSMAEMLRTMYGLMLKTCGFTDQVPSDHASPGSAS